MAVPVQTPSNASSANGVTVVFPYTFLIFDEEDLAVTGTDADGNVTDYVLNVDYTVDGVDNASGGNVTFASPPSAGITVLRRRIMAVKRDVDYQNNGDLLAAEMNRDQDIPLMLLQQLEEQVGRAIKLPAHLVGAAGEVGGTLAALKPLVINEDGTGIAVGETELTGDMLLRPELAAEDGGELIGWRQDATGNPIEYAAPLRDLHARARDTLCLFDFIPADELAAIRAFTSTTDVSTNVQRAVDAAAAQGKVLDVPFGLYNLGATVLLPDRLVMRGRGWSVPYSGGTVLAPQGSVFKLLANANCDAFRQAAKATRYSLRISNIAVDGNGANQSSNVGPDGIYGMYQFNRNAFFFEALYNSRFENVFAYNMRGAGWALHGDGTVGMTNVFLFNCHAYNCRTYSIYCEGNLTDLRIYGGDFGFGRVANLRLTSSATINGAVFWTSQCQDPTDPATHSTGTGAVVNGGVIIAGDNNTLAGFRSEGNAGHGVKIVGSNNRLSGGILYFNASTAATAGSFDGINDAGDDNVHESMSIRQSSSSPHALRKAIKLEAAHSGTRIIGGSLRRVGANAALVNAPVDGFSHAAGDRSDFSWANGYVLAFNGVAHSIGTSATKVQFRTETTDARGEWDTANDEFTAAEAGTYRVDTGVNIANVTDGNSFIVAIYKNGSEFRRLGQQRAGAAQAIQIAGSVEMKLEAGDKVDVRATCGTASNTNIGAAITWLEITQING